MKICLHDERNMIQVLRGNSVSRYDSDSRACPYQISVCLEVRQTLRSLRIDTELKERTTIDTGKHF